MKTVVCNECGSRVSDRHVNKYGVCSPCISKTLAQIPAESITKVCRRCNVEKEACEFHKNKMVTNGIRSGLDSWCKECRSEYQKERRIKIKRMELNRMEKIKRCTKCGANKPTSEFHKNPSTKDGLQCACKSCLNKQGRETYLAKKMANAHNRLKESQSVNAEIVQNLRMISEAHDQSVANDKRPLEKQKPQNLKIHAAYLSVISFLAVCILILLLL